MSRPYPPEPTPEQCSVYARVEVPGEPDMVAYAVWWPQMGGHSARAVVALGSCQTVWLWHDGQFPYSDKPPQRIHLCDPDQWVDLFTWLKERIDVELNGGPHPYVWDLPQGVSVEQAAEVHRKAVEWGLWEPDPGGFEIWPYGDPRSYKQCAPIPCPSFAEFDPAADMNARGYAGSPLWRMAAESTSQEECTFTLCNPALCTEDHAHRPTLRWAGLTVNDCADSPARYSLSIDPPPQVDAQRDAAAQHVPVWFEVPADRIAAMLASAGVPDGDPADMPLMVGVPEGVDPDQMRRAIELCQRVGLIPETSHGLVFLPEGTDMP